MRKAWNSNGLAANLMLFKLDDIKINQKNILATVEKIKAKSGKRREGLVTSLISSIGTAFLMRLMPGMPGT